MTDMNTPDINFIRWIGRLAGAIQKGTFKFEGDRIWNGFRIGYLGPLFCSYGQIGYTIEVPDYGTVKYDWEFDKVSFKPYGRQDAVLLNTPGWTDAIKRLYNN